MPHKLAAAVLLAVFSCCPGIAPLSGKALAAEAGLTVFAAASTTNALTEIAKLYESAGHAKVALSFASSSTLAKQIENGAPAEVFISANAEWMDHLEKKNLLESGTRADLLGNSIVLVVPSGSPVKRITVDSKLDLAGLLGKDGRLAVGDPAHVPVGTYAKAALEKLGLWNQVAERIAPAKDVRSGLALVERGECPLGIVYASDSVVTDKVRIAGVFPKSSHPNIDYPVAVIQKANVAEARKFVAFLSAPEARAIWKKFGFEIL